MDPDACVQRIVDGFLNLTDYGGFDCEADINGAADDLFSWLEGGGFDPSHEEYHAVMEALFWFYEGWHGGQWSESYSLLCRSMAFFHPGAASCAPEPDSMADMLLVGAWAVVGVTRAEGEAE